MTSRITASTATSAARIASSRVESWCVCTATASTTSADTATSALKSSTACGNREPSRRGAMKSITPAAVMATSTASSTAVPKARLKPEPLPAAATGRPAAC